MKLWILGALAAIIGAGLMAGCIDQVADPELDFHVMEVQTNTTSPNPGAEEVESGHHFLYVKVRVENLNRDADLTIGPRTFTVDDNDTVEVNGAHLANADLRDIDSIRVDPLDEKIFWVVFKVPDGYRMLYIRYVGTLDEPKELSLPEY